MSDDARSQLAALVARAERSPELQALAAAVGWGEITFVVADEHIVYRRLQAGFRGGDRTEAV